MKNTGLNSDFDQKSLEPNEYRFAPNVSLLEVKEDRIKRLLELQSDRTRWFSQQEFDELHRLADDVKNLVNKKNPGC